MRRTLKMLVLIGLVSLNAMAEETIEVSVTVKHIIIDNSLSTGPKVDFTTACKVNDTIEFIDMRKSENQNALPKKLLQTCKVNFLGRIETLVLYAGGGVYLKKDQTAGTKDEYSYTTSFKGQNLRGQTWALSSEAFNDETAIVYETDDRVYPGNDKRTESLRVYYTFKKK